MCVQTRRFVPQIYVVLQDFIVRMEPLLWIPYEMTPPPGHTPARQALTA